MRNGFSMIELVFVIVILGVLAAVAVPKFVATRLDVQVAAYRSDIASMLKLIPAKVFADNLQTKEPSVNGEKWSDWMINIGGLDRNKWMASLIATQAGQGISPVFKMQGFNLPCGSGALLQIRQDDGHLHFSPQNLVSANMSNVDSEMRICQQLQASYKVSDTDAGNRLIPLQATSEMVY